MMETRWQNVKTLFAEALQRKATERSAFLDEACSGAPALRIEVEELLRAHERAANDFALPAAEVFAPLLAENFNLNFAGQKLGAFRLEDELGRGGMGVVYRAQREDGEFEQKVAIKVLQTRSAEFLRRFRHERQTLAALNHPNIARLYDGGVTTEGSPYFVMEYVAGHALHDYCKSHGADLHARLLLFLQICEAVRYAHQHSIVHRDLKPGNILVNKEGVPKLLDFGIAKLLQPHGVDSSEELTLTGFQPMTLPYASPEQVRNEIISTVSDVYALGVILYELLAGRRPYDLENASPVEIARIICEVEPKKPSEVVDRRVYPRTNESEVRTAGTSTLRQQLAGDLDSIVLKALRKEPEQRYSSVEQLAEDLRRHLDGRPVHARKGTWSYRAGRFIKQHRAAFAALCLFFVTLVAGSSGIFWQAQVARQERDLALRAAHSMIYELAQGLTKLGGPTENRLTLLKQAAHIFDDITTRGHDSSELKYQNVDANRIIAQTSRVLGDLSGAEMRILRSEAQLRDRKPLAFQTVAAQKLMMQVLLEKGEIYYALGKGPEAIAAFDEVIAAEQAMKLDSNERRDVLQVASAALVRKGDRLLFEGKMKEAEEAYRQCLKIKTELYRADTTNLEVIQSYKVGLERLGDIYYAEGKVDTSCFHYRQALRLSQIAVQIAPEDALVLRSHAITMQNAGFCSEHEGRLEEALTLYRDAVTLQRQLLNNDPNNLIFARNLMGGLGTIGNTYLVQKDFNEAVNWYNEAFNVGKRMRRQAEKDTPLALKIAEISQLLADGQVKLRRINAAKHTIAYSRELLDKLITKDPEYIDHVRTLAYLVMTEGELYFIQRQYEQSRQLYEKALALWRQMVAATNASDDKQLEAYGLFKLGESLIALGHVENARMAFFSARKIFYTLQTQGQLSPESDGFRLYLPQVEKALAQIDRSHAKHGIESN